MRWGGVGGCRQGIQIRVFERVRDGELLRTTRPLQDLVLPQLPSLCPSDHPSFRPGASSSPRGGDTWKEACPSHPAPELPGPSLPLPPSPSPGAIFFSRAPPSSNLLPLQP